MSKKKRFGVSQALSRGLSETIHVVENNLAVFRNVILPLSRIELDPDNPRKLAISLADVLHGINKNDALYERKIAELDKLKELANTIESSGVINPIVVYKRGEVYRIVAGERRCLASLLAGRNEIEARVFNEKPRGFELKLVQWIENTAREDLTLDERMGNICELIREYQLQHGEVAVTASLLKTITGLSLPQATYYMAVLNASQDVKQAIKNGMLRSLDKAALIVGIESPEIRGEALQACIDGCSLKELRRIISQSKQDLKKELSAKLSPKRGRAATRVNMGFTHNPGVVRAIVESVLEQATFKKYETIFSKVNWDHFEQTAGAFKKLVDIIEQEIIRERV